MTPAILTLGAARVRVWQFGAPHPGQPPLLYLHGFEAHPGPAPFLIRLARQQEVWAPEHPGYGESSGFESIHDVTDLVLHYRRLIEHWGVGRVDLMGHSLGGMFAAEIAALCPHLVRRLVLVDAYGLWLDAHPAPDPFVMPAEALARAKFADPGWAGREPTTLPEDAAARAIARTGNLAAATKFMWPVADRGLARRLPFVHAPTLVVHGAADGLVPPAHAEAFARLIPAARVAMIPNAGHLPMVEQEDAFLAAVADPPR
ncbi:MAG: alpha/beta hydrolase [Rhodospirillales bacterium]|nr:alpha/beta hydrolase [Rhodospirillales bacterium]